MWTPRLGLPSLCLLFVLSSFAAGGTRGEHSVTSRWQIAINDLYRPFLINKVFNYFGNNGGGSYNPFSTSNEGFEFPKGTGKTCVYEDGVVWGGYHKGRTDPKVGGSAYLHGLQAGPIIQYGTATSDPIGDDPANPSNRIYRVRPDMSPRTPFAAIQSIIAAEELPFISRYEGYTEQEIYDQYIKDWNEWPADLGAPFVYGKDSNNVQRNAGPYDPQYDIPGQPGADQTLWYVANDCNIVGTMDVWASPVIGLEMQRTIWGYNRTGALGQTIFLSTLLINKSGAKIDSMFLVQWADPDVGVANNDYAGCDTSRDLGFDYNGTATDTVYGTSIPAVGYDIVQGPIAPGAPDDTAGFRLGKRPGYRNLRMSAFVFYVPIPVYEEVAPEILWYRLMNGTTGATGSPIIDPTTMNTTKFCLSGDPVQAQDGSAGWVDGILGLVPSDRRFYMTSGPFTMAAGDTQEMVVALTVGLGTDYLSSITALRSADDSVQRFYDSLTGTGSVLTVAVAPDGLPSTPQLLQNYPNPFNPTTAIRYQLSAVSDVKLVVYDILGREVAELVNERKAPGSYEVRFDATGLASGIYLYRLTAGSFVRVRKMVLVR